MHHKNMTAVRPVTPEIPALAQMPGPMKILIVSDAWYPQVNGVVRTYEYLLAELESEGHTVKIIGPSDFPFSLPMPGYNEIRLVLQPYYRLARMIESFAPDTIHIAAEGPLGWAARRYCLRKRIGFTSSYHTHFPDYIAKRYCMGSRMLYSIIHTAARAIVRHFHAPSKAVLVATESLQEELQSWGFKNPMRRLTRGANLALFYPGPDTVFKDLPKPVALYVGRVAIEKNLEDFLAMPWEGSKVIVGHGPSLDYLRGKYPAALFAGKKEGPELAAYYRSADLFVFPSRTDTFGIVLLEALASGLPVAAYDVMGPRDIITQDFLGALHPHDLGAAARKALARGTREERADFVREHYTWAKAGQQFEEALRLPSPIDPATY